jgi:hypothetical protein
MPTVKLESGKVVTKEGKVSCNCCVSCNGLPAPPSAYREIEITASEFAQIYAGGTVVTEQSMGGSNTATLGTSRSISAGGSLVTKFEHTLVNTFNALGFFRQNGCDKRLGESNVVLFSPSGSYEYFLLPTDIPILNEGLSWGSYEFISGVPNSYESIVFAPYNKPFFGNPFQYGLYVNRASQGLMEAAVSFINQSNVLSVQVNPNATMSSAQDNDVFELVLPTRTVEIPIRVAGGTFSEHRVTYSPSAP